MRRLGWAALVVLLATGCVRRIETAAVESPASVRPLPDDRTIELDPVEIVGGSGEADLSGLNAEELFALGKAALAAEDVARAILHFEHLADFHLESPHRPAALMEAGLGLLRMGHHAGALGRFLEAAGAYGDAPEGVDAIFRAADAHYFLGHHLAAAELLEPLTRAEHVAPLRRAEAETKRAICLLFGGETDEAERVLRRTILKLRGELRDELTNQYLPSQAQFYLAEIYRTHFGRSPVDASKASQSELLDQLERKAQLLLSAQGHYLRCIRLGHPEWATASGYRIGELYQSLYEQLVGARVPEELDEEQAAIYREELHRKIRVLVIKAIDAYEKTLATAERVGATNPFVQHTREQLEQMKALLLEEEITAEIPGRPGGEG